MGRARGLIEDATRDTTLWLQSDPSAEERAWVLAIQEQLADLSRIVERRVERRSLPNDSRQWSEGVAEVLSRLEKAREVRGSIVCKKSGCGLSCLAERLPKELPKVRLPEPVRPVKLHSTGIIPGQFEGRTTYEDQSALPPGLREAGDPVEGNPFPAHNPRHAVWQWATLNAEEELCRQNSQFMRDRPTRDGFMVWMERRGWDLREFENWMLKLLAAKFDIWAKRGCYVVWDENDLQAYGYWLFNYARAWLDAEKNAEGAGLP